MESPIEKLTRYSRHLRESKHGAQALIDYRHHLLNQIDTCWKKRSELREQLASITAEIEANTEAMQSSVQAVRESGEAMLTLGCSQDEVDQANRPKVLTWNPLTRTERDPVAMIAEFPALEPIYGAESPCELFETRQTA